MTESERVIPPNCPRCGGNVAVVGYNTHCDKNPHCPWITCTGPVVVDGIAGVCNTVIDTRKPGRWMEAKR